MNQKTKTTHCAVCGISRLCLTVIFQNWSSNGEKESNWRSELGKRNGEEGRDAENMVPWLLGPRKSLTGQDLLAPPTKDNMNVYKTFFS